MIDMAFGRQLPPWFGRQAAPPIDPSIMGMLPQAGQDPQFTAGAQIAPAAQAMPQPQAPQGPSRSDVMGQRALADSFSQGGLPLANVQNGLGAAAYAIHQGLAGWTEGRAKKSEEDQKAKDRKALADALNSSDPMTALSQLDIPEVQDWMTQAKIAQMTKAPSEKWQDVDANGDGQPDAQRNSVTGEYKPIDRPLSVEDRMRVAAAGRSNNTTTVNTGGGSDKQIFDTLGESYKMAQTAATGLNGLREAEKALKGQGIYGAYADQRLLLAKVAVAFGADPSSVVDTETFRAAIAPQVAAMVKATVGSTQISNADRTFAENAAGGSITLDKATLQRLVNIGRRASEGIVKAHNQRLDRIYPNSPNFVRERALFEVPMDTGPKKIGSPQEYNALKPGEQYVAPDGSIRIKQ